ncbi:hypothetical protein BDN72DRAFT_956325 [Pluteus cervinus]|uniref:Uncharacterized protein n=1 Tax=Pluteus cervinus TaxID=181527 RepID=A0ACD3B809_9AGAR|nr:hypothetical protein BDN72DRAFT_956325 [Pluteus cervinus]
MANLESLPRGLPRSQSGSVPRPPPYLAELPFEILTEIVQKLSWKDILRVRQTCNHLAAITTALSIWRAIAQEELGRTSSRTPGLFLERPLDGYNADELEHLILRWKSAEIGWTKDDGSPARERKLDMVDVCSCHLVKGGRWLLVSTWSGSIVYYDLDEEKPTQRELITVAGRTGSVMSVDIDQSSPTLTFNLALGTAEYPPDRPKEYIVEVWRVHLGDSAESRFSTLSAELLASFHPEPQNKVKKLSILGDFVAFCVDLRPSSSFYTIIVNWTDSSYPRWLKHSFIHVFDGVRLLPQHQVLLRQGCYVRLFNFISFWHLATLPTDLRVADVEPFWEAQLDATRDETIHEPLIYDDCSRLVFATTTAVFGLTILHPLTRVASDSPGTFVKLCDIPQGTFVAAIPAHSLCYSAFQDFSDVTLIHHPWPDEDGHYSGSPTVIKKTLTHWGKFCPTVDIQTGRVITGTYPIGIAEFSLLRH